MTIAQMLAAKQQQRRHSQPVTLVDGKARFVKAVYHAAWHVQARHDNGVGWSLTSLCGMGTVGSLEGDGLTMAAAQVCPRCAERAAKRGLSTNVENGESGAA